MSSRASGWSCLIVGTMMAAASTTAFAQEKGQVGITMGYPSSVGVVWHVSDKLAVRPELSFAQSSSEVTVSGLPSGTANTDGWNFGTGVSGLFYVRTQDQLHLYVSPRWTYSRVTSNSVASDITATSWSIAGSFGAQYALSRHFAAFGELGLAYTHARATSTPVLPISSEAVGHTTGTRTGVGVIVYF